jgi:small subunit ribosomal protein S16
VNIKEEIALKWLRIGAQPTETVRSLFSKQGIMMKFALEKDKVEEEKKNLIIENWKKLKAELEAKKAEKKKKKNMKKKEGAS